MRERERERERERGKKAASDDGWRKIKLPLSMKRKGAFELFQIADNI